MSLWGLKIGGRGPLWGEKTEVFENYKGGGKKTYKGWAQKVS